LWPPFYTVAWLPLNLVGPFVMQFVTRIPIACIAFTLLCVHTLVPTPDCIATLSQHGFLAIVLPSSPDYTVVWFTLFPCDFVIVWILRCSDCPVWITLWFYGWIVIIVIVIVFLIVTTLYTQFGLYYLVYPLLYVTFVLQLGYTLGLDCTCRYYIYLYRLLLIVFTLFCTLPCDLLIYLIALVLLWVVANHWFVGCGVGLLWLLLIVRWVILYTLWHCDVVVVVIVCYTLLVVTLPVGCLVTLVLPRSYVTATPLPCCLQRCTCFQLLPCGCVTLNLPYPICYSPTLWFYVVVLTFCIPCC